MKTAISLPDTLYRHADRAARRWKLTRSRLFTRAVEEYLENHEPQKVTERLDSVYQGANSRLDKAFVRGQSKILVPERW